MKSSRRVARQTYRLREIVDHGSDIVEGVIELFRVGPVAVSKTRVIGRDKAIAIRKPAEERRHHQIVIFAGVFGLLRD